LAGALPAISTFAAASYISSGNNTRFGTLGVLEIHISQGTKPGNSESAIRARFVPDSFQSLSRDIECVAK
jgi:hypothetical protein